VSEQSDLLRLQLIPLEDRIYEVFSNQAVFNTSEVKERFPAERARRIYDALDTLVKQGRLKFRGKINRVNHFSPVGTSILPYFQDSQGNSWPISEILNHIDGILPNYEHRAVPELSDIYPLIARLFLIAREDDIKKRAAMLNETVAMLNGFKKDLTRLLELIEGVQRHPSMNGSDEAFITVFRSSDPAMPSLKNLTDFELWWRRYETYKDQVSKLKESLAQGIENR